MTALIDRLVHKAEIIQIEGDVADNPGHLDTAFAVGVVRRDHDHDSLRRRLGRRPGVIDDAPSAEVLVLLECAEALTGASPDHDGPDVLGVCHKAAG
mgnify:CR=1 FL=1